MYSTLLRIWKKIEPRAPTNPFRALYQPQGGQLVDAKPRRDGTAGLCPIPAPLSLSAARLEPVVTGPRMLSQVWHFSLILGVGAAMACRQLPSGHQSNDAGSRSTQRSMTSEVMTIPSAEAANPPAADDASAPDASAEASVCNEQAAQEFLVNAHFNGRSISTAAARDEWKTAVARSIRYRTEQYGYFSGFGSQSWNPRLLRKQLHTTHFFGLPVRLHEKVIPALHCVEQALRQQCADFPYQPHGLSGARDSNTYFDGDVSNHVYGIAIDIDPLANPCCNCIEPWRSSPRCQGKKTDFERMVMPACWVTIFERFGFYWLGHDTLKDTMHFEFLGDPDKIRRSQAP